MYKSKLQELCCQKSWPLPKYAAIKEGPDHKPLFKASVFANGAFFDSPTFYGSLKQAHNEAAKVAFTHFTSPGSNASQSSPVLPVSPTSNHSSGSVIPSSEANDEGLRIKLTAKSSETFPQSAEDETATGKKSKGKAQKHGNPKDSDQHKASVSINLENSKSFDTAGEAEKDVGIIALSSLSLTELPKDSGNCSKKVAEREDRKSNKNGKINAANVDAGSAAVKGKGKLGSLDEEEMVKTNKQKAPDSKSYLLCNRVKVYSYVPDIADLPKGITVMQITKDKWAAVHLDFSYKKGGNSA